MPNPPPLPDVLCAQPTSGCVYRCGDTQYDLSSLRTWTGGVVTSADQKGSYYRFSVCGEPLDPSLTCTSDAPRGSFLPAAVRHDSDGSCTTVGTVGDSSTFCRLADPARPESGMWCGYFEGDSDASFLIEYDCAEAPSLSTIRREGADQKTHVATMAGVWHTVDGCSQLWRWCYARAV